MKEERLQHGEILLQVISSVRSIDGRISEIKQGILGNYYTESGAELMKERMKKLIETRMMLLYSLQDSTLAFSKYIEKETGLCYNSLKREITEQ